MRCRLVEMGIENGMTPRIETLRKARERMVQERDVFAKVLSEPFDQVKAERARAKFLEFQALVESIDRAIAGEAADGEPSVARP